MLTDLSVWLALSELTDIMRLTALFAILATLHPIQAHLTSTRANRVMCSVVCTPMLPPTASACLVLLAPTALGLSVSCVPVAQHLSPATQTEVSVPLVLTLVLITTATQLPVASASNAPQAPFLPTGSHNVPLALSVNTK